MAAQGAVGDGSPVAPVSLWKGSDGSVQIADAEALFLGDYSRQGHDLVIEHDGKTLLVEDYFSGTGGNLVGPNGAFLTPDVVKALAGPMAPGQYAQAGDTPATALLQIGKVVSLDGSASATHSDGVTVTLANGDPVYQGDVVQTGEGSKLGISFIDDTVFSMSASARMVLNELVFDPANAADSSMVVNLVQGSFVFVTGKVAPAGDMKVETPVATMGIRGTTPTIDIIAHLGVTEFSILPDPGTGKVGNYVLMDKTTGEVLGNVNSEGSKWVITSLSNEVVELTKSNADQMKDEEAAADIRAAVSKAYGERTDLGSDGQQQQIPDDSSGPNNASETGQGKVAGGPGTAGDTGIIVVDSDPLVDNPPVAGDDFDTIDEDSPLGGNVIIGLSPGGGDYDPEQLAPLLVTQVNGVGNLTFGVEGYASISLPQSPATIAASELAGENYPGAELRIFANGTIIYFPQNSFQWLAKDESATDTFTYTVRDKYGFTDTATVTITITGNNDVPVITSTAIERVVAESAEEGGVGGGFVGDDLTGTLSFTDVDITDTGFEYILVVDEQPANGAIEHPFLSNADLQALLVVSVTDEGSTDTDGMIEWEFVGTEEQFDYLAAGESVSLVYTIKVVDQHGAVSNGQTITIRIVGATDDGGSNDTPVISVEVGGGPADDDSDDETIAETNSGLTISGTLTVTETDRTDEIDLSVLPVVVSSESSDPVAGRPDLASLQSMLIVTPETILTDTVKTAEQFTWTFNSGSTTFDYLADGEKLVLVYTIQATDGIDPDTQIVTITITGTNDVPVVAAGDVTGGVTELTPEDALVAHLVDTGTIAFTDVDLTDMHSIDPTIVASDGALGTLTASVTTQTVDGQGGVITWNYSVDAALVEYLAEGEEKIETFTITLDDGNGATVERTISVTITGTNDAPVIVAEDLLGGVTELVMPAGTLTDRGEITFSDVDLTDVHLVSATGTYTGTGDPLGTLSAVKDTDTTGTGGGGQLTWTYTVAASAVEYLAKDQTKVETFTITLDDQNGGVITKTIAVTITGTNDAPVIEAEDLLGAVTELVTPAGDLTNSGIITFSDVDLTDVHLVSATGTYTGTGDPLGTLSAVKDTDTTGTGSGGQLTWTYTVAASAVEYLAKDQTKVETFTITLDDQNGGVITKTIEVTITGTNDAPLISGAEGNPAAGGPDTLAATISIDFTDADVADAHAVTVADVWADGPSEHDADFLKGLLDLPGPVTGGSANIGFSAPAEEFAYLGEGETLTLIYSVRIGDGNGGFAWQNFAVTIAGAEAGPVVAEVLILNDAPAIVGTSGDDNYSGDAAIEGTGGADLILGLSGSDDLLGGGGDDFLYGGDGDDYLVGGAGQDTYFGGDGWDMVSFRDESEGVTVDLSIGTATLAGGVVETLSSIEDIEGSAHADELIGDAGDNFFLGGAGADAYDGGDGWDQVSFHNEDSIAGSEQGAVVDLFAGTGTDTYGNEETFANIESLRGSRWADVFTGDANDNAFRGLAGADIIDGGEGFDTVRYDRDERHGGGSGVTVDLATGYAIDGFGDQDSLSNIEGAIGTRFGDTLIGDSEDNEFVGLGGDDYIDGGEGWDRVGYWEADEGILVDMTRSSGQVVDDGMGGTDTLVNIEEIDGSQFDDTIIGNWEDHDYDGDAGNDLLLGGTGNEYLGGGDGDDRIDGGIGDDWMRGGEGADTFIFGPGSGQDHIGDAQLADFDPSEDKIDLRAFPYESIDDLNISYEIDDDYTYIDLGNGDGVTIYGVDLTESPEAFIFYDPLGGEANFNIIEGTPGDDLLVGTSSNDLILTNDATPEYGDDIYASLGSDAIDFSGSVDGFYNMHYWVLGGYIDIDVTIGATGGTIDKGGFGIDTLTHLDLINGEDGGLGIYLGDGGNNDLVVDTTGVGYVKFDVGGGVDTLSISGDGYVDVDLFWGYYGGVTVNVEDGIATDGFSVLTVTGGFVNQWRGTADDDTFYGGNEDESFITNGGNNIVDGGGGFDRVRYDRDGVTSLKVAYSATEPNEAVVTGLWHGEAFQDTLTDIEWVRGAREGVTEFLGSGGEEQFEARGGFNIFDAGGGDDWLIAGGDGNLFVFKPASGEDTIQKFVVGRDWIDLSDYDLSSMSGRLAMSGADTVISLDGGNTVRVIGVDLTTVATADVFILNGVNGTPGNDNAEDAVALLGTMSNDSINGLGGNDELFGNDGNDVLRSGGQTFDDTGSDYLDGGNGNDLLIAEGGFVNLRGGAGNDTLVAVRTEDWWDYARADYRNTAPSVGIVANLSAVALLDGGLEVGPMQIADGYGTIDTVYGIHAIADSGGDDFIRVDGSYRNANGAEYFDVRLTGGNDTVDFTGAGIDVRVNYRDALDGVIVDLAAGTAKDADLDDGDQIGADTLINVNHVRGTDFDDTLLGNDGDNRFRGYAGNDIIDGRGGRDIADYYYSSDALHPNVGITVTLGAGTNTGTVIDSFGDIDTLIDIEVVTGSQYADTMTGNDNANEFWGDLGNDTLHGGGGNDILIGGWGDAGGLLDGDDMLYGEGGDDYLEGGAGNDTLSGGPGGFDVAGYYSSYWGIEVDLTRSTGQVVDDGFRDQNDDPYSDTLIDIEVISGSQRNDVMVGNGDANEFWGNEGDDELDGGDGRDVLDGGKGDDTLIGGSGDDWLFGDEGDDQLFGGDGSDTLVGGDGSDTLVGGDGYDEFIFYAGEWGVDEILDFGADSNAIVLNGFGVAEEFTLANNAEGGSYLMFGGQVVASLADVSFDTEIFTSYDADQHVITLMSVA